MVTVIFPWRGGCEHRERAYEWVRGKYEATWPHYRLVEARYDHGPWCLARAIHPHLRRAPSDSVVCVCDADSWCEGLPLAVEAVASGEAEWAQPHWLVKRLSREGTDAYMAGGEDVFQVVKHAYAEPVRRGMQGGAMMVAKRDTFLEIPYDPRFVGWGGEEEALAMAWRVLLGKSWRGTADLYHCWHPPQYRMSRRWGSPQNRDLRQTYQRAKVSPEAMRTLVEKGRGCLGEYV